MPILPNHSHELFAQALAKGMTADASYVEAGYKRSRSNATRLSAKESVLERVMEIQRAAAEATGITVQRLVEELVKIATADITQAVKWGEALPYEIPAKDGEGSGEFVLVQGVDLVPSVELPKHVTAAISEVRKTREGIAIKFHDKGAAIEKLGRYLGMFKDKLEINGKLTLAELVAASYNSGDKAAEK